MPKSKSVWTEILDICWTKNIKVVPQVEELPGAGIDGKCFEQTG